MILKLFLAFALLLVVPFFVKAEVISDGIITFIPEKPMIADTASENITQEEAIVYKEGIQIVENKENSLGEEMKVMVEEHPIIVAVAAVGTSISALLIILEI